MKISLWILIFSFATLFKPYTLLAIENLGSTSAALGGAGVGTVNATDGTFNNPASIALFEHGSAALSSANKGFRVSLSDNGQDSMFPAAIGYHQSEISTVKTKAIHLIVAKAIENKFSFGASIQMQDTKIDQNENTYKQTLVDVATMVRVNDWLTVGAAYKNKPLNDTDLSDFIDYNPSLSFGLEMVYANIMNIRIDTESAQNISLQPKQNYKFGLELLLNDWFIGRLGYQNNNVLSQNYSTVGFGFGGTQFGLHYAYVKESNFEKDSYHSVDLAFPF